LCVNHVLPDSCVFRGDAKHFSTYNEHGSVGRYLDGGDAASFNCVGLLYGTGQHDVLTLPIFMPIVTLAGFNEVWFAVLMLIVLEFSLCTPPFGLLLFV